MDFQGFSTEGVGGNDEIRRGVAVGLVGVIYGFEATAIVVAIGGEDTALPGAGEETASGGVGVIAVGDAIVGFPRVVLLDQEAAVRTVDPGGGGGFGAVGGHRLLPVGVVVGVSDAVSLAAGGFLDVAVREVVGGGDVDEVVAVGIKDIRGIDFGSTTSHVIIKGGAAVAGVGHGFHDIGSGGEVGGNRDTSAGIPLMGGALEGVVAAEWGVGGIPHGGGGNQVVGGIEVFGDVHEADGVGGDGVRAVKTVVFDEQDVAGGIPGVGGDEV